MNSSWPGGDARLQYGGAVLEAACDFAARLRREDGDTPWPLPRWIEWWRGAMALLVLLTSLPRVRVTVSHSPSGRIIERNLRLRGTWHLPKNRIAQGVLPVPDSEMECLQQGRRLMRRQLRRARQNGVACSLLVSAQARRDALAALGINGPEWVEVVPDRLDDLWWVALDSHRSPVAIAMAVVDGEWAMLALLKSTQHPARYLLHAHLATMLGGRGVRYLLTTAPTVLRMEPNLRQFQRMLGYRVVHLSLAAGQRAG